MTLPVVAIVGYSNSGKTIVATYLVEDLTRQGYRVAAVKHCHGSHSLDRIDSDTDRLYKAGAISVIASSPGQITSIRRTNGDSPLESIVSSLSTEADLVIAEGFKLSAVPKVLVVAKDFSPPQVENVIAVVNDDIGEWDLPTYKFDTLSKLANQLRERFLDAVPPDASISLAVDGQAVPLKPYPRRVLRGLVKDFVSSLKGVPPEPRDIQITIRIDSDSDVRQ